MESILLEWEAFARSTASGAQMSTLALRDHAEAMLLATARDMESPQSASQQKAKSRGHSENDVAALREPSELHAVGRLGSGFDLMEVVSEYRALRASVLQLWRDSSPQSNDHHMEDVTRFNESIDQSLTKAVSSYTRRVDQSRDLFLAMLSHDLRNPLNAIAMSATLLPQLATLNRQSAETASQISESATLMARMISDLLDFTRTRLGAGMPITPAAMDLGELCRKVFAEYRSGFPNRTIRLKSHGDLTGEWDADRLRQMISNLMGNAIQHGAENLPVDLTLHGEASHVVIVIHNGGLPIEPGELLRIFEPLVRGSSAGRPNANRPGSIGLGLYIAREIALAHGGTIDVASSVEAGTSFTVRLPRRGLVSSTAPLLTG